MRLNWVLMLAAAVACAGLAGCDKGSQATIDELRGKLAEAVTANGALAARLKQLDPAFAAAVNKAESAPKTADGRTSTNTNVNTEVKLIDLGLLSPREEKKPAGGDGTNTNVNTEVKLIDLSLLSPNTNDQVRANQSTIQALSNRIAQQDAEIARLTAKLARHGINSAPE